MQDGELVSGNVLADFLGLPNQSVVDRFRVSSDSNVLVLETSDSILRQRLAQTRTTRAIFTSLT